MKELLDGFSVEELEAMIARQPEDSVGKLARIALAVKQAQPLVFELNEGVADDVKAAFAQGMKRYSGTMLEIAALERNFVIPEPATLTNINQLCPLDLNLSQTEFATGWNSCRKFALTQGGVPPIVKGVHAVAQGWNACRDAMLAATPQLPGSEPATVPGRWIPVSERMPEIGEQQCYVLAADFKNHYWPNIPNTQVGVYGDWFDDGNPTWDDGDGEDLHLKEVTHWMPLPAAPQQEKPA